MNISHADLVVWLSKSTEQERIELIEKYRSDIKKYTELIIEAANMAVEITQYKPKLNKTDFSSKEITDELFKLSKRHESDDFELSPELLKEVETKGFVFEDDERNKNIFYCRRIDGENKLYLWKADVERKGWYYDKVIGNAEVIYFLMRRMSSTRALLYHKIHEGDFS